jgi:hypothetical protein
MSHIATRIALAPVFILGAAGMLCLGGCSNQADGGGDTVQVRGTSQGLFYDDGAPTYRVAAVWSTERTEHEGVLIQSAEVSSTGSAQGTFDMLVSEPPSEVMDDAGRDGDYSYTSADFVLLEDSALEDGWVDAQLFWDSVRGRSESIVYYVDRDIPADSRGHFGIGPVGAGFHVLARQADQIVLDDQGRESGAIAVWEELASDELIHVDLGSDGDPNTP